MLYWTQVWKQMHETTGQDVEKRAVMELISYIEKHADRVIKQSGKELEKKNELFRVQGLRKKQRIDRECVKKAIKSINNEDNAILSERTGGSFSEAKRKKIKHPKESTEVA